MREERLLIVNADDFGQSPGVNRGIIQAHERGVVTSASLMVRWPAAIEAATYARRHPALSVGLHLDYGEWSLRDGKWRPLYEVVDMEDSNAVQEETARQIDAFVRLVGREPTHIDSHQHVHKRPSVTAVVVAVADRLEVPLRHFSNVRYCGSFYGQDEGGSAIQYAVSVDDLIAVLNSLPFGVNELACHPGLEEDVEGMYRKERALEVETLCDPRVRDRLESLGMRLTSFAEINGANLVDASAARKGG